MSVPTSTLMSMSISFLTAILTVILAEIIKTKGNMAFYIFKLKNQFIYDQRMHIMDILSKNKMQLLRSAEVLNHRLWNLIRHNDDHWLKYDCTLNADKHYYYCSFIYRFISVFSRIHIIEDSLIYYDTTVASKEDLDLIKFLRLYPILLSDVDLFKTLPYDNFHATDHIFRNVIDNISLSLITDNKIISYNEFCKDNLSNENTLILQNFLHDINPNEDRYRWDRLFVIHIHTILFLNNYGYDFQYTDKYKLNTIVKEIKNSIILTNYISLMKMYKLENNKELKILINILK